LQRRTDHGWARIHEASVACPRAVWRRDINAEEGAALVVPTGITMPIGLDGAVVGTVGITGHRLRLYGLAGWCSADRDLCARGRCFQRRGYFVRTGDAARPRNRPHSRVRSANCGRADHHATGSNSATPGQQTRCDHVRSARRARRANRRRCGDREVCEPAPISSPSWPPADTL